MNEYSSFTDSELIKAVELMISKDDLMIREAAEALLAVFSYSANEVREQVDSGEYLSDDNPLGLVM